MKVLAQDIYWPEAFAEEHHITRIENLDRLFSDSDFISAHKFDCRDTGLDQ